MRKGFTLVEILAVIIIISVLSLIVIPTVIKSIEKSKKDAFINAAYNIKKVAELEFINTEMKSSFTGLEFTFENGVMSASVEGKKLYFDGKNPKNGKVRIDKNGKVVLAIHDGKYCAEKGYNDDKIIITEKELSKCRIHNMPSEPELSDGMIPIVWDEDKWVKADINEKWYDYENFEWANVVLVTSEKRNEYKLKPPGTPIVENDVLAYLVWIPRYKYKLFNVDSEEIEEEQIKIIFEDKNTPKSNGDENGEW
ncbi:MAG: prepilin-type N-terminal cleavage/methylation domain-containing protein, partial [Mollicutes bacterium]|nr:prepilin-type N-terminal cleavage/methylation domain-containing protein [Mollicutes bacterium]